MPDIVVTVPMEKWDEWLAEGDAAGDNPEESGREYFFTTRAALPKIQPGERVYIVAHGKLRGYAPLVRVEFLDEQVPRRFALVRRGGAQACTIVEKIYGFRGYRYRWWSRDREKSFPDWKKP